MDQSPPSTSSPQPPMYPQTVLEPLAPPPRRESRVWARFLMVLLLLGLFGSLALNVLLFGIVGLLGFGSLDTDSRVQEKYHSLNRYGADKVAILSIEGMILSGEGFLKQQIDRARKDANEGRLKAIVLRVNSPGGSISGSDYIFHHLRKLAEDTHIPIVVSMGGIAASGGYYVSMCVGNTPETIFAEPSTLTGSIGVVIPHYNFAELMGKWGIQEDAVSSQPLKTMGSFARKMTDEERAIFQGLVNEGFTDFKNVIREGRPEFRDAPGALEKVATGQIFNAAQARENGLIDKIGFVEDAIDRAISLAKLDKENVKVVKYKAEPRLSDIFFGQSRVQPSFDLAALLESTTPRAYYLCTWLPILAGTGK